MIQFASKGIIPDIKNIWKVCFGDEDSYIDFYLEHRFDKNHILVWMEEKSAVAMVHLFPATLFADGHSIEIMYVYAVATLPQWRGRHLTKKLLDYAKKYFRVPFILVPASDALFQYYEKLGFQTAFWLTQAQFDLREWNQKKNIPISFQRVTTNASSQAYQRLRNQMYLPPSMMAASVEPMEDDYVQQYVAWDQDVIHYALLEHEKTGGIVVKAMLETNECYLLCRKEKDLLMIKEMVAKKLLEEDLDDILYALLKWQNCQRGKIRLPSYFTSNHSKRIPFAMASPSAMASPYAMAIPHAMDSQEIRIENGYFGLAFDEW